jgi:polysaccharide pyruvyl transferase CsaB
MEGGWPVSRVVLSGYYGFNNAGDEAILYAIIHTLRNIEPGIEITVLSNDPVKTARQYNVKACRRWKLGEVTKALLTCDLLISGGGSLLQDVTSKLSPLYYLGVILMAKLLEKPVIVYAQGIGPLKTRINRNLTSFILNRVNAITVRDQRSKDDLLAMGVERAITVTADPVLGLSPEAISPETGREILERNGLCTKAGQKLLGIYIRSWKDNAYLNDLVKACDQLAGEGWKIVFVPMQFPGDITISRQAAKQMKHEAVVLKEMYSPEEILSITKNMDLVIGMRLHALIKGAVAGVPVVGLSYDPKVDRFLEQIGQQALISVENLRSETLIEMVNWTYSRREEISKDLQSRLSPMYQKAWQNARIALGLLQK